MENMVIVDDNKHPENVLNIEEGLAKVDTLVLSEDPLNFLLGLSPHIYISFGKDGMIVPVDLLNETETKVFNLSNAEGRKLSMFPNNEGSLVLKIYYSALFDDIDSIEQFRSKVISLNANFSLRDALTDYLKRWIQPDKSRNIDAFIANHNAAFRRIMHIKTYFVPPVNARLKSSSGVTFGFFMKRNNNFYHPISGITDPSTKNMMKALGADMYRKNVFYPNDPNDPTWISDIDKFYPSTQPIDI